MGKKVYNAKARRIQETIVDNSAVKNIKIDLGDATGNAATSYDEANQLVLPSKKRATKIKVERRQNVKILTKKQRKHLQGIVNKKKKKEGRADVLEALSSVQIPTKELQQYTSISKVQSIGLKRLQTLDEYMAKKQEKLLQQSQQNTSGRPSAIKGAIKRKLLVEEAEELEAKRKNPNIIGLDDDEEEDDDDEDEDEDEDSDNDDDDDNDEDNTNVNASKKSPKPESKQSNIGTQQIPAAVPNSTRAENTIKPTATTAAALPTRRTMFVPVHRTAEVQAARLKLPILAEEQQVMETINENSIIIVAGETGSGKTTQIPQFLYESGYAANNKLIGITEPRRVAAIAMSKRVAHEMNLSEQEVSYLIRFEGNVTPATRIKFMTDGVLLKEIESDFLLNNYAVIILDEAHERSAYTDILVGLLSRIVPLRLKRGNPLKLIVMSATLRVEDFTMNERLFKTPPPLIKVEARQYPVTIHFQKQTPVDYVDEAFRKTIKIHSKLPEGGILIFVTGQQEVNQLIRKLRRTFPYVKEKAGQTDSPKHEQKEKTEDEDALEFDMKRAIRNVRKAKKRFLTQIALPKINLDDYKLPADDTDADLHEIADIDSDADVGDDDNDDDDDVAGAALNSTTKQPLWVLPLYSLLSNDKQQRIFQPVPNGCRLCVVSTNVAETSLTIPNIKYVVDSGRQKTRLYDKITGVSAFVVTYTSKASADQRAGRAGRVSAGHCYRLYSSAVYNDHFEDFTMPDIQKKPVDDLMLQMRCMGIDRVINFPFPSPPDIVQLRAAEQRLTVLGALQRTETAAEKSSSNTAKDLPPLVTKLGHVISRFPVAPRFGKMLALSHQQQLLPYTVCLVAALSVQELLVEVNLGGDETTSGTLKKWQTKRQSWAATGNFRLLGDPMVLLRAVGAAEYAGSIGKLSKFCSDNGLRQKAITEVRKLRVQLTNEINLNMANVDVCVDPEMPPPTDAQARFLRQILLAGMGDRVARKLSLDDISDKQEKRRLKYAYNCGDMEEPVFMHASSVLKSEPPEWVVYQEVYELQNGASTKMFMRGLTAIEPEWLLLYVPLLCNIRQVREDPAPRYNSRDGKIYAFADATFGKAAWELPLTEIEMPPSEMTPCYFGMFLLDGQVCPQLAPFKAKLKSTPSSLIKSWSNLNQHLLQFKRALIQKQIYTRDSLFDMWLEQPNYLLEEYQNLLYDVALSELTPLWPPTKV